jgi:cysteine desulfurase/selenocysteine lyase
MEIRNRFPFFRKNADYVYLDSAATTQTVDVAINGVKQALEYCGNPNRSAHRLAKRNEQLLEKAKKNIAKFINAKSNEIVFTGNATDSINRAVCSISNQIKNDDVILISISEHHSNLLPYLQLEKKGAKIKLFDIEDGLINPEKIKQLVSAKTKILAIAHCSNVLGNINNVKLIGEIAKKINPKLFYFVDGAQAVAHIPVDVKDLGVDFYAFSSHKCYGPDGVGVLYVNEKIHHMLEPTSIGGGQINNIAITHEKNRDYISPTYKEKINLLVGGTANVSNIIGFDRAIGYLQSIGFNNIRQHEIKLIEQLINELNKIKEIKIYGPTKIDNKIGLVSFAVKKGQLKDLENHLDKNKICIRFGSHCAFPLAEKFGTETLRVSLGIYNTARDIERLITEINYYFNKISGKINNPLADKLKNINYFKKIHLVNSKNTIIKLIDGLVETNPTSKVIIMGGHFLGIPDFKENIFWPSIRGLLPKKLECLLEEFGMTSFPLFTLDLACDLIARLKNKKINAKLLIIANDTTGINELRLSSANTNKKTADQYRKELLNLFSQKNGLPEIYQKVLKQKNLNTNDLIKSEINYYYQETLLRSKFKFFIKKNDKIFSDIIEYKVKNKDDFEIAINIINNQAIKTCTFDTFNSKTGGKFCIVEIAQLLAEVCGVSKKLNYNYINQTIKNINDQNILFIMLSPAMCDNAVNSAAELYIKLFLYEDKNINFKFINIPFGPNAETTLKQGIEITETSNL